MHVLYVRYGFNESLIAYICMYTQPTFYKIVPGYLNTYTLMVIAYGSSARSFIQIIRTQQPSCIWDRILKRYKIKAWFAAINRSEVH